MQKNVKRLLFLLAFFSIFGSCKKEKTPLTELEKLPPITKTGAKTFGCLVNGTAWTPYGIKDPTKPNYSCSYDGSWSGGNLGIQAFQYENDGGGSGFLIGIDSLQNSGKINYTNTRMRIAFSSSHIIPNCGIASDDINQYFNGYVYITRFDLSVGIISGTFNFTCKKDGCDTLRITDGRLDWKF